MTNDVQELVRRHLFLVQVCAKEVVARYPGLAKPEDLLGPGAVALIELARGYRADLHPSFEHYARNKIYGRMLRAAFQDRAPLWLRSLLAGEQAMAESMAEKPPAAEGLGDPAFAAWKAAEAGCQEAVAAVFLAGTLQAQRVSSEQSLGEIEAFVRAMKIVRAVVEGLGPDERAVFDLLHVKDLPKKEAAKQLGVHPNTIHNRHVSILQAMRRALVAQGITEVPVANDMDLVLALMQMRPAPGPITLFLHASPDDS